MIQFDLAVQGLIGRRLANVYAASFAKLDPTILRQPAIGGTDSVRMNLVTASEFARARQSLPGFQIVAENSENNCSRSGTSLLLESQRRI